MSCVWGLSLIHIWDFFRKTTGVATTAHTDEATIIQTRHRIPEQPLTESQIMVYQVPLPEPLRWLEPVSYTHLDVYKRQMQPRRRRMTVRGSALVMSTSSPPQRTRMEPPVGR